MRNKHSINADWFAFLFIVGFTLGALFLAQRVGLDIQHEIQSIMAMLP